MSAPKGNLNAYNGRKAQQALEIAVRRLSTGDDGECIEKMEVLVQIWIKAINKAKDDGDIPALNAIMDRLDGKPPQAFSLAPHEDGSDRIQEVKITFVNPEPESS